MKKEINKKIIALSLSLVVAAVFLLASPARAGWGNDILAGVCGAIVSAMGWILVKLMGILVYFAQYNGFIQSAAVTNGWVIVRDVCNMFFVLILLVIAFATILQIEEYNYKKWLPKLILMAVLINFSKMICGLLIDAAQIIMLTFVNSFKDVAGANLTSALGIKNWQNMNDAGGGDWQVTASLLLAVVYVVISVIVIAAMLAMIAMRIVMLWIYIVLSPAAYLFSAFPAGKKYASQWWTQFTQNLVVGPVLAFFIWLSFTSLATFSSSQFKTNNADVTSGVGATTACVGAACTYGAAETLIQFIIAIGMLLGGMKITQEIGGVAGSAAGSVFNKGTSLAISGAKGIGAAALWTAKQPLKAASWANDRFLQNKGIADLNIIRVAKEWKKGKDEYNEQAYTQGKVKAGQRIETGGRAKGALAMTALGEDTYHHLTTWRGVEQAVKGGKRMKANREKISNSPELEQAKFEAEYANLEEPEKRNKKLTEIRNRDTQINSEINTAEEKIETINGDINTTSDPNERAELQNNKKSLEDKRDLLLKEKFRNQDKLAYAQKNERTVYSKEDKESAKDTVDKHQRKIDNNVPMINYNTKMAEQAAIQKESAKISLISDSDELLRLLKSALQSKDTAKASAVMVKLTKDGNDNEFTQTLDREGDTSFVGIQRVMEDIANSNHKNYGGFTQQQAFSLGATIGELNKSVNHWEAVGGFKMDNGLWRESTPEEAANISLTESGKRGQQEQTKDNNRLAYGKYVNGKLQLTASGTVRLMGIAGLGNLTNVSGRQNENAAKNILPLISDLTKDSDGKDKHTLRKEFENILSQEFVDAMAKRLGTITSSDPLEMLKKVKDIKFT